MASRNSNRRTRRSGRVGGNRPRTHPVPDLRLREVLGRFSDALAAVAVAHRALDSLEIAADESQVLRTAVAALRAAYDDLDAWVALP